MQVFLPYPDFAKSVHCLDPKRLGNQVYRECVTLLNGGWPNHPASRMWCGFRYSLARYALAGIEELWLRGFDYPEHRAKFESILDSEPDNGPPPWLGDERFHRSHQSNLVRKLPDWYRRFFPDVPSDLPYVWPSVT